MKSKFVFDIAVFTSVCYNTATKGLTMAIYIHVYVYIYIYMNIYQEYIIFLTAKSWSRYAYWQWDVLSNNSYESFDSSTHQQSGKLQIFLLEYNGQRRKMFCSEVCIFFSNKYWESWKRRSICICNCIGCAYIIVVILVGFRKIWQSSKKKLIKETPPLLQATKRMMFKNIRMSGFFQKRFLTLLVSNQRENIHRYKKNPENKP